MVIYKILNNNLILSKEQIENLTSHHKRMWNCFSEEKGAADR